MRAAALKGIWWEVELRASFPMIVLGLMGDLARAGEARAQTEAIEEYVRETEQVRRQVADEYRTNMKTAKKLFNCVMFGRSVAKWKKVETIQSTAKSSIAEKFETEMKKPGYSSQRNSSRRAGRETESQIRLEWQRR